jgi:hypothetical protein
MKNQIFKKLSLATLLIGSVLLVGCASQSLKAPCPDYGKYCDKTPINSWDTSTV